MILLWFILGMLLIFAIARYNESNKLFWTLLFSFVMGFAGTKMITSNHHGYEQGNDDLTQVYPTQVLLAKTTDYKFVNVMDDLMPKKVTASKPVSQGFTPVFSENSIALGEVFGRTRDQPLLTLIKPPELCLMKAFSTLHDTG